MTAVAPTAAGQPPKQRRGGFPNLLAVEFRLLLREPMILFWALIFPVGLLVVLGSSTSNRHPHALGGLRFIVVYTPILMTFTLTLLSLSAMPATLASYRDKGYLKRLSTTPVGAFRLLAAQLALVAGLAGSVVVLIMLVAHFAFSVPLPSEVVGFILAILLTMAAMAALGLLIASLASSQRVAGAIGGILFFPLMFFAGLWVPQQAMSPALRTISQYTPLGAAVPSITSADFGQWPGTTHLVVLAAYAVILLRIAIRFFRWDR
ncbi:MAG TPA: ABC transporter permease [Solirubrobacteraceae bacterium]|nr:ABC transporter permease [Solirubrobacteraceae bacterium]